MQSLICSLNWDCSLVWGSYSTCNEETAIILDWLKSFLLLDLIKYLSVFHYYAKFERTCSLKKKIFCSFAYWSYNYIWTLCNGLLQYIPISTFQKFVRYWQCLHWQTCTQIQSKGSLSLWTLCLEFQTFSWRLNHVRFSYIHIHVYFCLKNAFFAERQL